jgi:autophagy-related protein 11
VADAPIPEAELVEDVNLELPSEPSRLEIGHPLDESPNPLLRALPSYERQFRFHYQKAQGIWRGSQRRYDLCR